MIDWQTPFVYAFELLMFTIGWVLVFLVVAIGMLVVFAIVRGAFLAFAKVVRRDQPKTKEDLERDRRAKLTAVN